MSLKFIYTFFIGILLTLFIGFGISAFYEEPLIPETPINLRSPMTIPQVTKTATFEAQNIADQIKLDNQEKNYQKTIENYNKIVSTIGLIFAVIYLIMSLNLNKNLQLISDSLLLGGIFTLLYSISRGFKTQDDKFQFITVAIGLIISLILGYIKFIKPLSKKTQ